MPNRIDTLFATLRREKRKGFIAYIAAGDPDLASTKELALAFEKAGVDLLELGVPFSDPLADGIVNQLAAQRALAAGVTAHSVLECVRDIRRHSQIPIVLYTYMNPIEIFGFERFHREAEAAGVDGLLILDLPPDECGPEYHAIGNILQIRLVAPTTPAERIARIAAEARGFIYYVSREGVTGERAALSESIAEQVALIRRHTDLPVVVGFGISTPEQAREVARSADAVVVGSAIVKRIADHGKAPGLVEAVANFVRPLTAAVREIAGS